MREHAQQNARCRSVAALFGHFTALRECLTPLIAGRISLVRVVLPLGYIWEMKICQPLRYSVSIVTENAPEVAVKTDGAYAINIRVLVRHHF